MNGCALSSIMTEASPLLDNEQTATNKISRDETPNEGYDSSNDELLGEDDLEVSVKSNKSSSSRTAMSGGLETGETGTTNIQTMIHIFKGNVGTGVLSLPSAVMHAGIIVGPLGLLFVALIAVHSMHLLVRCSHFYCRKYHFDALSYGDVAEEACKSWLGEKSHYAKRMVNTFLVITQFGFCSIYFVFVADTIMMIGNLDDKISIKLVILALALPVVLLSFIRSLEKLAYISIFANVLCVGGLIMILQYLARNFQNPNKYPAFVGWKEMPTFASMAIFSFEGIGVVLPLENEMKKPEDFSWVMNCGMAIVATLFIVMGLFGYLAFGNDLYASVTLNLPPTYVYDVVKAAYAIAMFFTYFLQFYVPMQIILPPLLDAVKNPRYKRPVEYLCRAFFVMLTCIFAIIVPGLDIFISLVGSVASSGLAIIFPPFFHILTFKDHGLSKPTLIKDILIILFGLVAFATGGYSSINSIVQKFETPASNITVIS